VADSTPRKLDGWLTIAEVLGQRHGSLVWRIAHWLQDRVWGADAYLGIPPNGLFPPILTRDPAAQQLAQDPDASYRGMAAPAWVRSRRLTGPRAAW